MFPPQNALLTELLVAEPPSIIFKEFKKDETCHHVMLVSGGMHPIKKYIPFPRPCATCSRSQIGGHQIPDLILHLVALHNHAQALLVAIQTHT